MRDRTVSCGFAFVLLTSLAAQPTLAQASEQPASSTAAPMQWTAPPTGKYHLELTLPERVMQADLTIADSSGNTTALFWPRGDNDGHVMAVTVKGIDLLLSAATPRSPLEIVLQRRGDILTGRWTLGTDNGPVQGRTAHDPTGR